MSAPSAPAPPKRSKQERLRDLLPDLHALLWPRRWVLLGGMILVGLTRLAAMTPALATKLLIDDVIGRKRVELLPFIAAAVAVASLFQQVANYALTQIFSRSTTRLIGELRCKLAAHVLRLSLLYHDRSKSGSLGARIMNDVAGLQNLVGAGLLGFAGSLATSLIALGLMAHYSRLLGAIAAIALLTLGVLVARGTRRVRAIAHERTTLLADLTGRLTEALGGVRVLKAYRAEPREDGIFAAAIERLVDNQLRSVSLASGLNLGTGLLWGLVSALVLYVGAGRVLAGQLRLGELYAFLALLGYAVAPLQQIVGIGSMLMEALAGVERTREILREPREDQDPGRTVAVGRLRGDVVFDAVTFAYAAGAPVLHGISFRAAPGTVTALVGPSGSGKSTTVGLVASFYKPTSGKVLVDDADITTLELASYRAQLGVVLQETFLFAGTILENVAFARPEADRAAILAACRAARVDEFAEKLPGGYEAVVGERGVMLSGGQRQRISIARALLADPRILILDEATASLDTHSEALIQEALSALLAGRTTFVIAHRLSTIRRADQILVVDGGEIRERGTHAELLARRGLYAEMVLRQHHVEADLFLAPGEGGGESVASAKSTIGGGGEEAVAVTLPVG